MHDILAAISPQILKRPTKLNLLRDTDLTRLARLKIFPWLTPAELKVLGASLALSSYKREEVISCASTLAGAAHVLLAGIARLTYVNADNERVTVHLIPPGLLPELPSPQ